MVFLKTSEQAACTVSADCTYTWIDTGLPTVTSYDVAYNTNLNDYVLTIVGTGFPTSTSQVLF